MENSQSTTNQNPTGTELQPRHTNPNNNRKFMVVIISILLTAIITGLTVYYWQKSVNEKVINNLEQKISSLDEQISTMNEEEMVSQTPLSELTDDWKTFTNTSWGISFNYPNLWHYEDSSEHGGADPGSTYSFFSTAAEIDHSFGDHRGNEILVINDGEHVYTFEESKIKFYPESIDFTVAGKPAYKTAKKPMNISIFVGPSEKRYLIISVRESGKQYIDQILSSFQFKK